MYVYIYIHTYKRAYLHVYMQTYNNLLRISSGSTKALLRLYQGSHYIHVDTHCVLTASSRLLKSRAQRERERERERERVCVCVLNIHSVSVSRWGRRRRATASSSPCIQVLSILAFLVRKSTNPDAAYRRDARRVCALVGAPFARFTCFTVTKFSQTDADALCCQA